MACTSTPVISSFTLKTNRRLSLNIDDSWHLPERAGGDHSDGVSHPLPDMASTTPRCAVPPGPGHPRRGWSSSVAAFLGLKSVAKRPSSQEATPISTSVSDTSRRVQKGRNHEVKDIKNDRGRSCRGWRAGH